MNQFNVLMEIQKQVIHLHENNMLTHDMLVKLYETVFPGTTLIVVENAHPIQRSLYEVTHAPEKRVDKPV